MSTLRIGVSGINAVDNPGPGVPVARSLKEDPELDVHIIGLAYDAMEPGIYMDWVIDQSVILPYPSQDGPTCLARLLDIQQRHGLDLIIPNLDAELPFYIHYQQQLAQHGIRTFLPSMEQFKLRGKDQLAHIAGAIDLDLPETLVLTSTEQLHHAIERLGLPMMVKGCFYKAEKVRTVAEAVAAYHHLVAEWGYPIIAQQVVAGDELNVVGVGDGEGGILGMVGVKKVWVTSQGKMWTGVTVRHASMLLAASAFVEHFHWRGPFELECIVQDDRVWLIEINPRFPAWTYFATGVGVNLPSLLVRRCRGQRVEPVTDYPPGKLFVRYSYELVTDMTPFQQVMTRGETR